MTQEKQLSRDSFQPCDRRILDGLYRKNHRKLTFICFRYVRDWDDAREMAQEAFLKAFRNMGDFESRSQPMTWITRIAINECLSYVAKRGKQRLQALYFMHDPENGLDDGSASEARDAKRAADRLLGIADPVTRKVLGLILRQGLNQTQIAAVLGVSRVAITRRITRLRGKALRCGEFA
jgi:RNA polymerase sigma factor (sigma-70 family)